MILIVIYCIYRWRRFCHKIAAQLGSKLQWFVFALNISEYSLMLVSTH